MEQIHKSCLLWLILERNCPLDPPSLKHTQFTRYKPNPSASPVRYLNTPTPTLNQGFHQYPIRSSHLTLARPFNSEANPPSPHPRCRSTRMMPSNYKETVQGKFHRRRWRGRTVRRPRGLYGAADAGPRVRPAGPCEGNKAARESLGRKGSQFWMALRCASMECGRV